MAKNKTSVQNNLEQKSFSGRVKSGKEGKNDRQDRSIVSDDAKIDDSQGDALSHSFLSKDKYNMSDGQKLVKSFNVSVSRLPFFIAFMVSVSWVIISISLLLDRETLKGVIDFISFSHATNPNARISFVNLFSLLFFPLCFFWFLAIIAYRTQEAKNSTRAMIQAAFLISQPQKMAKDALISLSGFVRQEVKMMDSGIENALEKATQLQGVVHDELDKLYCSYSEQKSTLSILLHDLATERETMLKTVQELRQQTIDAYEPIVKENDRIEELIKLSTKRVKDLSETLKENIEFFVEANDKILDASENNCEAIVNASDKLVWVYNNSNEKIDKTVNSIDSQAFQLKEATSTLVAANTEIDSMLQQRHEMLADMVNKVDEHTDSMLVNVDNSVLRLAEGITSSEEKVRKFSEVIRNNSVEDVKQALDGFSQISGRVESESHKIRSQMKDDYSATLNDIWNRCEQTSEVIGKNISQMHNVASVALHEVSETRKKLDEAMHELPRETARTSKNLKQAIDGHIKTLKDLAKEAGQTFVQIENIKAMKSEPMIKSAAYVNKKQEKQQAMASNTLDATHRNANQKWKLNDLIANAKRAEQTSVSSVPSEKVGSPQLSSSNINKNTTDGFSTGFSWNEADMVRAFSTRDLDQLWLRHQNGEKNVFTELLYTREGLSLFKEIQSRYRYDANFRTEVDSYLDEFETLLFSANNSDRHQMLLKTYLTSETGCIYLLLAHASGRLS